MIDISGATHAIATTFDAANIGGLNTSGGTIIKTDEFSVSDLRISEFTQPTHTTHNTIYMQLGPFTSNKKVSINISMSGKWHITRIGGKEEFYNIDFITTDVDYGFATNESSTTFSGPSEINKHISNSSSISWSNTYTNQYILIRWVNPMDAYLNQSISTENISRSTISGYMYVSATQEGTGTTYGNNKCVIKSELPTYNCRLKNPVPSGTNYMNNQTVEWFDIGRADCTVTFYNEGTLIETRTISVGSTLGTLPTSPTKTGYTFNGWKDAGGTIASSSTIINNDTRYDADYTINTYTLTYYTTDGNASTGEISGLGTITLETI